MGVNFSVDDKIKLAIDMCDKEKGKQYKFNYIYSFTNENINAYIDMFDLNSKSLFTVGSSCDQALNAVLNGCKDITIYDICPFFKEYFYLKYALIKMLSRKEYLEFLCYKNYSLSLFNNRNVFSKSSYDKIFEYLKYIDEEASYFWNQLYNYYTGRQIRENLFTGDEFGVKTITKTNRYLNDDDAYNMLCSKLDNIDITFECGDIFDIDINKKYDNIFLSNIATYHKLSEVKVLFDRIVDMLNNDGKMLLCYLFDVDADDLFLDNAESIYSAKSVIDTFSGDVKYNMFTGVNGISINDRRMNDAIITYKKLKKI